LRGDDGLGRYVAQRLAQTVDNKDNKDNKDIKVLALHQLTPELAEDVSQSELVIFVDASCEQEPGRISCRRIVSRSSVPGATTHHLDPSGLLAFTWKLYGASPKMAILLTVGGESFGHEEALSPTVQAAMPILEQVLAACIKAGSDPIGSDLTFQC